MTVYNERHALPHRVMQTAVEGRIEERAEGPTGFVRELEADLVLSLETAMALRAWLDDKIRRLEGARRQGASVQ